MSRTTRPARRRSALLHLSRLEDRIAPATVRWNVDANGFWDVATNPFRTKIYFNKSVW